MSFLLLEGGGHLVLSSDNPAINWLDAEEAIRKQIEAEWAAGDFASMPLTWENELPADANAQRFMLIEMTGVYAEKTLYGGPGKRSSVEGGLVFYHAFVPTSSNKREALSAVLTMSDILELRTIAGTINIEGANPPSPVQTRMYDQELPARGQPRGNYYRCSGSVPFILIGTR